MIFISPSAGTDERSCTGSEQQGTAENLSLHLK